MSNIIDNSFYRQQLTDVKVLILAPHEDDEINIAGNTICNFINMGADVYVCFTTNGDYFISAEIRINEAVEALAVLGVDKSKIYILGYGDTLNNEQNGHIFYSDNIAICSKAGYTQTYGTTSHKDYCYIKNRIHKTYTSKNYHDDLKEIILDIMPEIIIAVDLDIHSDHRMLSLTFDKIIGEILCSNNYYKPIIWKKLAYALGYYATKDFCNTNLLSAKIPDTDCQHYPQQIIDTSYYSWINRIRLPVIENEYGHHIFDKIIKKALSQHKSQSAVLNAERIINGDEVFFERRTDSLSYSAHVTTSSGNGEYLNDFRILNLKDINSLYLKYENYLWKPDNTDNKKEALFTWKIPQNIQFIRLYGNVNITGRIKKIKITFSNGYTVYSDILPQKGIPLDIIIPLQQNIRQCKLRIIDYEGEFYGVSECEFYSNVNSKQLLKPFIKFLIEDNFIYKYIITNDVKHIYFDIYRYHCDDNIKISIVSGNAIVKGQKIIFYDNSKVVIRAEAANNKNIFDQVVLEHKSKIYISALKILQYIECNILTILYRAFRKIRYLIN